MAFDSFAEADAKILRDFGVPISNHKISPQDYFNTLDGTFVIKFKLYFSRPYVLPPNPLRFTLGNITIVPSLAPTQLNSNLTDDGNDAPVFNAANYSNMFYDNAYAYSHITQYVGLDHTSEYASSISISADYIVVGSNGYGRCMYCLIM
ncbi:hypothetical protein EON65_15545 [archaeon]|nr:MAG: hypothetical protein EON65_15545 [archaeon]